MISRIVYVSARLIFEENKMLISIVIPTRERSEYLRYTLASCTRIDDTNIEIIVSDNASADATAKIVAQAADDRIIYLRTPRRLSMRENFEFALSHANGDYVFMLGDDDALIPNQFNRIRRVLEQHAPDTLTGTTVLYGWPTKYGPATHGRFKLFYKSTFGDVNLITGEALREEIQRNGAVISDNLPRIYGGFASRKIVEKLKSKTGQVFMGSSPDIYFMFASTAVVDKHIRVTHPLFIGGASPKSNGASYYEWLRRSGPAKEFNKFVEDAKSDPLVDPLNYNGGMQGALFSHLEAARRYAYSGNLIFDYEREFERVLASVRDEASAHRGGVIAELTRFAAESGLGKSLSVAALQRATAAREPKQRRSSRKVRVRGYIAVDRVVHDMMRYDRTDIDAVASACEWLLGDELTSGGWRRPLSWARLLGRSLRRMPKLPEPDNPRSRRGNRSGVETAGTTR
ncbi:MAG: glycosyltransferase family 2 protein [Hyphomicrobiales bacterium]|nr:glycosyltransferase family 2 protein [Hyphomicrobiales bacterium]MDE2017239.1 glycosyltransferase family 2 protein [Hyphomicrobiales bacterium]